LAGLVSNAYIQSAEKEMPNLKNTETQWGLLSIVFHWLTLILVIGLYALGWYMVELDYYDSWYRVGPFWHKSFGLVLLVLVMARLFYRLTSIAPSHLASHAKWEVLAAKLTHIFLYAALLVACASGYLISTADGRGISFFDWFDVPALVVGIDNQEDLAGDIHVWATNFLVVLAGLHGLASLKHHFMDRDETLLRMLGRNRL